MDLIKLSDGAYAITIPEESELVHEKEMLKVKIKEAETSLKDLKDREKEVSTLLYVFQGSIPGSHHGWPSSQFMKNGKAVHLYELMPKGKQEFHGTQAEWLSYVTTPQNKRVVSYLNPGELAAHFDEVDRAPCPKCGKEQPIISYVFDPYGDLTPTYYSKRVVICCGGMQDLDPPKEY